MRSKRFRLNNRDFVKGIILTVLVAALTTLQGLLTTANDWSYIFEQVARASLAALIGYLIKNLFEDENGDIISNSNSNNIVQGKKD